MQILQTGQVGGKTLAIQPAFFGDLGCTFIAPCNGPEDPLVSGRIPKLLQQQIRRFTRQTAVRRKEEGSDRLPDRWIVQKEHDILRDAACR